MRKSVLIFISLLFLWVQECFPCTTFFINQNGQLLFGRNYDWVSGSGMVNTNLRGLAKTSFPMQEGKTISWVSQFGSITFNQYGKEFPTGGMNEQGLVVELMWLDETRYPSPDHRPAISVLQWIQYQLDNCATVEEVIATDKKLRIATIGITPLHYLIADKKGHAATVEFLNGRMIVHKGKDLRFPVLTNNSYRESLNHVQSLSLNARNNETYQKSSLGRFAKACSLVQEYNYEKSNISPVDYSFRILTEVAQGDFTKWSIVYNIAESKIYFKTQSHQKIKIIDFKSFSFSCTNLPMVFNMNSNGNGNIATLFIPFSKDLNLKILEKSFSESNDRLSISPIYTEKIVAYPGRISCQ